MTTGEKSYVTMEQKICKVCVKKFDTDAILLDRRLMQSFERYTTTGWGFCPEHEKMRKEGYVALVAIDSARSEVNSAGRIDPENAFRLNRIAHLRRHIAERLLGDKVTRPLPDLLFCEIGLIERLSDIERESREADEQL